ncbi:MAG: lipopolysaccharide kinase InaA family protein [Planctomycetota bacterium]|nr:lipopolysaccharide kinase InaA family protein [Planctomycetota bacterium]
MTRQAKWVQSLMDALRREGLDSVEGAFGYAGGEDLHKPELGHRRRTRLCLEDDDGRKHEVYLKRYDCEPFFRRLRRWLTYGIRRSPASIEFDNIRTAAAAGLSTMPALACGQEQRFLRDGRSYLFVAAVPGESLERCGDEFLAGHHDTPQAVSELTAALAEMVRKLHAAGYVHRDLYAAHVFLHEADGRIELYLIDLARMFQPRWRRFRWRVKDLAQLKYSMPDRWVEPCWQKFLATYLGRDWARHLDCYRRAVDRKVADMRRRAQRRRKEM